jgi:serine/threonine protein kinase
MSGSYPYRFSPSPSMFSYSPSPSGTFSPSPFLGPTNPINAYLHGIDNRSTKQFTPSSVRTTVVSGARYAGGYELGPVLGVGTYGEVRYGRAVDVGDEDNDDDDVLDDHLGRTRDEQDDDDVDHHHDNFFDNSNTNEQDEEPNRPIESILPSSSPTSQLDDSTSPITEDVSSLNALVLDLEVQRNSFPRRDPNRGVAIKLIDLNRFADETAAIMQKEIALLSALRHQHCIRLLDVCDDVACTGEWCELCACTQYKRQVGAQAGVCGHCGHSGSEHSSEETRPVLMIVTELALGGELFGILMHTGALQEECARYYFRQLMFGVQYLHNNGIVHRDLKPENLCFDSSFTLKIVDYGLSALETKPHQDSATSNTSNSNSNNNNSTSDSTSDSVTVHMSDRSPTGASSSAPIPIQSNNPNSNNSNMLVPKELHHSGVGSQPYSAPEVYYVKELYANRGYNGRPADIWSAAIILFVMLTGRPPFMRPLAKTYGTTMRRCKHFIAFMRGEASAFPNISPGAKDLLIRMTRLNPAERLTANDVLAHPWVCGNPISKREVAIIMEEKVRTMCNKMDRADLFELLKKEQAARDDQSSAENTPHARFAQSISSRSPDQERDETYRPSSASLQIPPNTSNAHLSISSSPQHSPFTPGSYDSPSSRPIRNSISFSSSSRSSSLTGIPELSPFPAPQFYDTSIVSPSDNSDREADLIRRLQSTDFNQNF